MKPRIATLVALVAAAHAATAGPNLLINGELEMPDDAPSHTDVVTGWTLIEPDVDAGGAPVNSAVFWRNAVANHTPGGNRGLWLRAFEGGLGDDNPATVNATIYQDVAGSAGVRYQLSAWMKFDEGFNNGATTLSLQFLDAAMGLISETVVDVFALSPHDGAWREFHVVAIADPGTAFVRSRADMIDGSLGPMNPQSAFIDDFTLVPTPGAAALLALSGLGAARRRNRA